MITRQDGDLTTGASQHAAAAHSAQPAVTQEHHSSPVAATPQEGTLPEPPLALGDDVKTGEPIREDAALEAENQSKSPSIIPAGREPAAKMSRTPQSTRHSPAPEGAARGLQG